MSSSLVFIDSMVGHTAAPLVTAAVFTGVVLLTAKKGRKALEQCENPVIPDDSLSVRTVFELVARFVFGLGEVVTQGKGRKYYPFFATLFLYILGLNLVGLIPGFVMPTDQFTFNFGVGLVVFCLYHYWGVKEVGAKNYLLHFFGPLDTFDSHAVKLFFGATIGLLLFVIETVSHSVRPLTLGLRLFGNMTGDHAVLSIFSDLTQGTLLFLVPLIFYAMGTIVCFLQAFIFTLLSLIYVSMSTAHEDDH